MSHYADKVAEIRDRNPFQLASDAECGWPDSRDSAGAQLLGQVRDGLLELLDEHGETIVRDGKGELRRVLDDGEHEIADAAPDVYTHRKWSEFVDLQAYNEDLDEFGGTTGDMDKDAGLALYVIARNLLGVLANELADALDEDADEV